MTKDSPLHPFEDSRCFWQAFVLDKNSGDFENGRKRIAENYKIVVSGDSSFLRTKSPLYLINVTIFLFWVIMGYTAEAKEKKGQ